MTSTNSYGAPSATPQRKAQYRHDTERLMPLLWQPPDTGAEGP